MHQAETRYRCGASAVVASRTREGLRAALDSVASRDCPICEHIVPCRFFDEACAALGVRADVITVCKQCVAFGDPVSTHGARMN